MSRIFHVGAHGVGPRPMFWLRPHTKVSVLVSISTSLVILAMVLLLMGCAGVVENGNGPMGPERITYAPAYPWRIAPPERAKVKTTTTPCGDVEKSEECEGGTCALKPPAK